MSVLSQDLNTMPIGKKKFLSFISSIEDYQIQKTRSVLHIFRRLRRKTSGEQVSKYFFYAIGEILLVVIGILIALQVNNWNEARKEKLIETKLLTELKEDLDETLYDLKSDINTVNLTLAVTDSLYMNMFEQKDENAEPYKIPFWYANALGSLYPKMNAYQSIQSRGIQIIQNPQLRSAISDFYELLLSRIRNAENGIEVMQENVLDAAFYEYAVTDPACEECPSLTDIFSSGNQSPLGIKTYFQVMEPIKGMDLQLMIYYKRNERLLSLYKQAEGIIRDIQQQIDSEINLKD